MSLLNHSVKALSTTLSVLAATVVAQGTYEVGSRASEFAKNKFTLWNAKNSGIKEEKGNIASPSLPNSGL